MIHHVAVIRRGAGSPPAGPADLIGKRIVVMQGDIMHDYVLEQGLEAHVTAVATQEEALRQLAEGRHDCALVARLPAMFWINKHGWDTPAVSKAALLSPGYCYAVPNNRKALLAQLNEGLRLLEESGEYRRIHEKCMGVYGGSSFPIATVLRYVALIAGPLLLALCAALLWLWSLRKAVSRRTEALRRSELRYRAIVQDHTEFIARFDTDFRLTWLNDATTQITEHQSKDLIGVTFLDFLEEEERKKARKSIGTIDADHPVAENTQHMLLPGGREMWIQWRNRGIFDKAGNIIEYQGVGRDITEQVRALDERLRLENQLLQAQKMESVGRLAGGVAHDFNNMLSVILGYTEMALEQVDPEHPLHADLLEIKSAAQRSADLTQQLLAFARKQTVTPTILELNHTVSGMLKMLNRLIGENIDLVWKPETELWSVRMDTVYGIVKQNDGFIDVRSESGQGTSFRIYLPRHVEKLDHAPQEDSGGLIGGGHETVLLVEDEPSCLNIGKKILQKLGYQVMTAGTPGEAIQLAEHHGVLDEGAHFIQKPFSREEMAGKVREALKKPE